MIYLLDTNVFIQAHRQHYGLDFVPGFWEWVASGLTDGSVMSIKQVYEELRVKETKDKDGKPKQPDALSEWATERKGSFVEIDNLASGWLRQISAWVMSPQRIYTQAARSEFLAVADLSLVAFAKAYNLTLVTHERPDPNSKKRVKIPDVCEAFDVKWVNTFNHAANGTRTFRDRVGQGRPSGCTTAFPSTTNAPTQPPVWPADAARSIACR